MLPVLASVGFAQQSFNKITPDLEEEMALNAKEMFDVIIVMNEQFDAQKANRQMQYLDKEQQRAFVMDELQQVAQNSQKAMLADLQQGQKAALVDNVKTFWLINAVSCAMTKDMVMAVAERPDVRYVMKNLTIHVIDGEDGEELPLDRATNQWNVTKVNADDVWSMGYTGSGVIVAVIDTGVKYTHTDIANNMWDGGTAYPHHGWDYVNNDNDPMDDHGHGSHCAGTVSSYGTNGKQCGIAKDAKILALKVLGSDGSGSLDLSWQAMQFAVSHDADVLSMSLGVDGIGGYWVERVVMENVLSCGVVASVAAGNVGDQLSTYPVPKNVGSPGNCPSPWHNPDQTLTGGLSACVTVGATTNSDGHSSFSSYGPVTWSSGQYIGDYNDYPWTSGSATEVGLFKPDIAAPGSNIVSLNYSGNTGYSTKSGTSMATPCVAGVMALMLQVNPMLTPVEIDSIIETTAVHCGGQTSKNNTFGAGRIDAQAAVNYMLNACNAPTNLTATVNRADVTLNWTAASGVSTYRVYRNGVMIANSVASTTYFDEGAPAGSNTYYVRSNGSNNKASIPSNRVTVTITTNIDALTPTGLMVTEVNTGNSTSTLTWNAPITREESLYYTTGATIYDGSSSEVFVAAQKYPASMLQPYAGMQIEHVYFAISVEGSECTVGLYEGDAMMPGTTLHEGSITTTEAQQLVDYELSQPLVINPDKDLWLTVATTGYILEDEEYVGDGTGNAFLYRFASDNFWLSDSNAAWLFVLELSDGDYTYNVYDGGDVVSQGQSGISYVSTYANGMNAYRVTAVTNGYESDFSNALYIVSNTDTENNFVLGSDDQLLVLPNSTLTVSGSLTNNGDGTNLVLMDGAQLVNNTAGVQATVKRDVTAYTDDGGWYTIATPFTSYDPGTVLATDAYDLYAYDEDGDSEGKEWINYKAGTFNLTPGNGYLYAHNPGVNLSMTGTLNSGSYSQNVTLGYANQDASIKGFNLLGNPTPHDISFTKTSDVSDGYYYLVNGDAWTYTTATTVPAGRGFLVKANATGQSVVLNPQSKGDSGEKGQYIRLAIGDDNAYLKLDEGVSMPLLDLRGRHSGLYFTQDHKPYVMLVRDGADSVDLSYEPHNGTQTLTVTVSETLDSQLSILNYLHLIDNKTGADIDLLATPSYTFESKTGDYASRFRLVFSGSQDGPSTGSGTFAYYNGSEWQISNIGEATLQVIDVMGRIVKNETINGNASISVNEVPGVYMMRLVNGNDVKVQKIVVK